MIEEALILAVKEQQMAAVGELPRLSDVHGKLCYDVNLWDEGMPNNPQYDHRLDEMPVAVHGAVPQEYHNLAVLVVQETEHEPHAEHRLKLVPESQVLLASPRLHLLLKAKAKQQSAEKT